MFNLQGANLSPHLAVSILIFFSESNNTRLFKTILPLFGVSIPEIQRKIILFPAPEPPNNPNG